MNFDNTTIGMLLFYIAGFLALISIALLYIASKK